MSRNSSSRSPGSRRGKNNRVKGATWERECVEFFRRTGFPQAKRHLEFQIEEAAKGEDIDNIAPFACQAKNTNGAINPLKVLAEINSGGFKIAMIKRTGKGWYAALAPDTLAYLLESHEMLLRGFQVQPPTNSEQPIRTLPEC